MELPNIAAYAYQDVHVWSALLTCLRPPPLFVQSTALSKLGDPSYRCFPDFQCAWARGRGGLL